MKVQKSFLSLILVCSISPAFAKSDSQRLQQLKEKILKIATEATAKIKTKNEFDPKTRKQLDPLVKEIGELYKNKDNLEGQLKDSVGAWKNVWADFPYTRTEADQTYQVFDENGYYYNISKYDIPGKKPYTSLLRGSYAPKSTNFAIEFTKAVGFKGFPETGTDLYRLAKRAELGQFDGFVDEENLRTVGGKGVAFNIYIDDEIRIWGGNVGSLDVPDILFVEVPVTSIKESF